MCSNVQINVEAFENGAVNNFTSHKNTSSRVTSFFRGLFGRQSTIESMEPPLQLKLHRILEKGYLYMLVI